MRRGRGSRSAHGWAMQKYLLAATRGFLWGYFLGFAFCLALFVYMAWHGIFSVKQVLEVGWEIFFSRAQLFFLMLGGFYAVYWGLRANDGFRRAEDTARWWNFFLRLFRRDP